MELKVQQKPPTEPFIYCFDIKELHAEQFNGPRAILSTLLFLFSLKNCPYVTADDAAVDLSETMTSSPWPWQWSRTHETHSILAQFQSET